MDELKALLIWTQGETKFLTCHGIYKIATYGNFIRIVTTGMCRNMPDLNVASIRINNMGQRWAFRVFVQSSSCMDQSKMCTYLIQNRHDFYPTP